MSMSDQNPNMRRLQFEWYAALATIVGGFVVAIAVAAYLTYGGKPATQTAAAPPTQAEVQRARMAALEQMGAELCGLELVNAQTFGVRAEFRQAPDPDAARDEDPRPLSLRGRHAGDPVRARGRSAVQEPQGFALREPVQRHAG